MLQSERNLSPAQQSLSIDHPGPSPSLRNRPHAQLSLNTAHHTPNPFARNQLLVPLAPDIDPRNPSLSERSHFRVPSFQQKTILDLCLRKTMELWPNRVEQRNAPPDRSPSRAPVPCPRYPKRPTVKKSRTGPL